MALGPESIPISRPAAPPPQVAPERTPNYGRRIIWLGVAVVAAIALYSAGWFYAAHRLEAAARETIGNLDGDAVSAECADLSAGGYPFRIGLFCSHVGFSDKGRGASVEAGAFRSAAQVYQPSLVVGEVDGPAKVQAPGLPPLDLSWDVLKASVRLDQPLPDRVSIDARDLKAAGPAGQLLGAADLQAHFRPDDGDIDLAGSVRGLSLAKELSGGRALPKLDGRADATLTGGVAWLLGGQGSLRGRSGIVREFRLEPSDKASLVLSGPFSVNEDGKLSADWTLALTGAPEMADVLAKIFPEQADAIRSGFSGLALLGNKPSLPLRIDEGRVKLAFVTLGEVPALR